MSINHIIRFHAIVYILFFVIITVVKKQNLKIENVWRPVVIIEI